MATNKQGKMQNLINFRMRITFTDGRQMTGQMLAFDKHMNIVLADTEEFRRVKRRAKSAPPAPGSAAPPAMVESEEKRTLGLVIIRGTHIVSCSVEGPPPPDPSAKLGQSAPPPTLPAGPGTSRSVGRGLPVGLGGPVAGIGGPAPPGFASFPPPGLGRAGPPFQPPAGFAGPPGGPPVGFHPPPGFPGPPGPGRGFPPPGLGGR